MKTLHILRHAKSSWADAALGDCERPLNKRGRVAAAKMARHFRRWGVVPDLVLCSCAVRARETLSLLRQHSGSNCPTEYEDALYLASSRALLQRLRRIPQDVAAVLLIGHNPGLHRLVVMLAGSANEPQALARLKRKYPTAALATLTIEGETWKTLEPGCARLELFRVPREL